jgi:peptidoglycan-associated lipoprotein
MSELDIPLFSRRSANMKIKSLGLLLLVVALGLSLSACGCFQQKMKGEQAPAPAPEQTKIVPPEQKQEVAVAKEAPATPPPPAAAPAAAAPAAAAVNATMNDIYFDFDKYNIRPGDAEILKMNHNWFMAYPGRVRIEGNCDERGTVEYNLVLGQKRADAAKGFMARLGVDADRMDTVSFGKEKPTDPGHNEAAWAKNRKVHFEPIK